MKNIKIAALAGTLMFCINALKAEECTDCPFDFGIKVGASNSFCSGFGNAKVSGGDTGDGDAGDGDTKAGKSVNNQLLNPWVTGGLYGGYAFNKYIGLNLELLYTRQGGGFSAEKEITKSDGTKEQKEVVSSTFIHNVSAPLALYIYPMGRESEEGIFSVHIGAHPSVLLGVSGQKDGTKFNDDQRKKAKEKQKQFDIAPVAGLGYAFPFGLIIEGRYSFGLMDWQKANNNEVKEDRKALDLSDKKVSNQYASLTVGYNFGNLLMQ